MKFTKKQLLDTLKGKLTANGKHLSISDKTITSLSDSHYDLLVNEETELDDFVSRFFRSLSRLMATTRRTTPTSSSLGRRITLRALAVMVTAKATETVMAMAAGVIPNWQHYSNGSRSWRRKKPPLRPKRFCLRKEVNFVPS